MGLGDVCASHPSFFPFTPQPSSPPLSASFIPYMSLYYCVASPVGLLASAAALATAAALAAVFLAALAATAEDYFTPGLTGLASALRLPPRLAGATLLALGNGAPDIGASVAAVRSGAVDLAHGALLGGGLFVGCGVAGCVLRASGGAPARGALVRDVAAYGISVATVAAILSTGAAGPGAAALLLTMYALYVATVAAADTARVVADARAAASAEPLLGSDAPEADLPPGAAPWTFDRRRSSCADEVEMTLSDMVASLAASPRPSRVGEEDAAGALPRAAAAPPPPPSAADLAAAAAAKLSAIMATLDAPLAFVRAATIPVPGGGDAWLPLACAVSPPVMAAYLGAPPTAIAAMAAVSVPAGAAIGLARLPSVAWLTDRVGPRAATALRGVASAVGFAAAALWVDAAASELVGTLQLVGVAARVPPAVLGGTLLAWGNSVGDLATNVAVARRGLPNMALTACFAGPLTNLLVGLGAGIARGAASGGGVVKTRLSAGGGSATFYALAMVTTILAVGAACGRRLPAGTAWALAAIYGAYVVTAVGLSAAGRQ